jgi:DNA repair protein RecO (recombination protein O)
MDWHDTGLITTTRPHGETSLIVSVFTRAHGLVSGLVKGARATAAGVAACRNSWGIFSLR